MDKAPNRNIQIGKAVPDFTFVSLDDESKTVTPKTLLGRIYLIDFWAVWCGPCVEEMEHLHAAYEKFKDKGFEIVSVSFDDEATTVADFRKSNGRCRGSTRFSLVSTAKRRKRSRLSAFRNPCWLDRTVTSSQLGKTYGELDCWTHWRRCST